MTRNERLTQAFNKNMTLMEIGPSYNPLLPKAAGWQTVVVDYTDQAELQARYRDEPTVNADNIEAVDIIWRDGALIDAIPPTMHGRFDGLIASHVGEHIPDLIGFFMAAARLLKPSGLLVLALPDRRLCFDFFQPLTTTGNLLDARGSTRHSLGKLFDNSAYFVERDGTGAWTRDGEIKPFRLAQDLSAAAEIINAPATDKYVDVHAWRFTPASFRLLMLELNVLGLVPWDIERLEPQDAVEFHVWLHKRAVGLNADNIASLRLELLKETIVEVQDQIDQLRAPLRLEAIEDRRSEELLAEEPVVEQLPDETLTAAQPDWSISVVIPLYNGAAFIVGALESVFTQTLKPTEVIVVDDGSTDEGHGRKLVEAMQALYPITLLSKPNGGQSSARNYGVAHSSGTLIALLDQDDVWYPAHLEQLIKPFLQPGPSGAKLGWVYSDLDEVDTEGLTICNGFLSTMGTEHPKRNLFACLREDMFVLPSASLIARSAFDAIGGFDERLSGYEDDDLFLRLFRAGYDNVFLKIPLSKWRIYPESSSYSYRMRRSRAIYTRKLLTTYSDDPKRSRFFHRDVLLPRFYRQALIEYRDAVMADDIDRFHETRDEMAFLVNQLPIRYRLTGRLLAMARTPEAARMLLTARRGVHTVLRVVRPILQRVA